MKIVYLWKNGQPVIVTTNEEGEYEYPSEEWTENKPDDGMYTPIYFDGQKWIGQSKEVFEKELPPEPIDDKDVLISNLSEQLLNTQLEIENIKKDMATVLELLVGKGSVDDVQNS
ncbi:hypothetical protein RCI18_05500 [Staphylococcus haemolyticus]|uniref:hypothetical protein n=1 Tax=Staphylococcus haemolyticus TaxID=1283 RepID=UPI0027ED3BDE|nr:hypothetical protein [Staphylococcus haemolyticus]MDQ7223757.1 hypothetical protein [Staphylococcus haemolyticus]